MSRGAHERDDNGTVFRVVVICILSLCVSFFALGVAAGIVSR